MDSNILTFQHADYLRIRIFTSDNGIQLIKGKQRYPTWNAYLFRFY